MANPAKSLPLGLLTVSFASFLLCAVEGQTRGAVAGPWTGGRSVCDTCACSPDNVAPVTVNCTCARTKLLIIREQDAATLTAIRELTLASCGFVSLPSSGLSNSTALARVTVRDMKLFHYTSGLFPALESLSVEDVGELVLDGFGPADRTLQQLVLRRTTVLRLVSGTVTASAPLRRVLFDRVDVDEIESDALDMTFVADNDRAPAAADGFTVVNSTIKTVQSGGVSVRAGAVRIFNSTLEDLAAGAVTANGSKIVRLSGNRLGAVSAAGDSVTAHGPAEVSVDGNQFRALPADLQLLKTDAPATAFRDNAVTDVDLGPFLFGVGPAVRVSGNRFECDCDPRRVSVLKLNQVFPGLLPEADNGRFDALLADNYCRKPAALTLAGYRDQLIKEIACEGTNVTAAVITPRAPPLKDGGDAVNAAMSYALLVVVVSLLHFAVLSG